MFIRFLMRLLMAVSIVFATLSLGCDAKSPTTPGPSPSPSPQPPASASVRIATIYPRVGATGGSTLTITGFGFESGATVTLGGLPARFISGTGTQLVVETPARAEGTVDVVVTNPDGQSSRLATSFTYAVFSLTVSAGTSTAGGQLSVSWNASRALLWDWIAIYRVGDPNTKYIFWWEYTKGTTSGTFTATVPTEPGEYEFRYLLDDDFIDVARSSRFTVN